MTSKILFIPLDNRPISYEYPQLLAKLANCDLLVPDKKYLGGLEFGADIDYLPEWVKNNITDCDNVVFSSDTLLYGGLVASRRHNFKTGQILDKLSQLVKILSKKNVSIQSSILRISDNNDNTEEKIYWQDWGRKIAKWSKDSYYARYINTSLKLDDNIPDDIKKDYLDTRITNNIINSQLLYLAKNNEFKNLVFGIDDSYDYGFNTIEANIIKDYVLKNQLIDRVFMYPGCDEVLGLLLAKNIAYFNGGLEPNIKIHFNTDIGAKIRGIYDGDSFENIVNNQLALLNFKNSAQSDIVNLVIHAPFKNQGDHIVLDKNNPKNFIDTQDAVEETLKLLKNLPRPIVLCDLAYANGSDPVLVSRLFENDNLSNKLVGYSAWNTAGNSIGSALSQAVCYHYGNKYDNIKYDNNNCMVKHNLFIRLVDDYAWQAINRKRINGVNLNFDSDYLMSLMHDEIVKIEQFLKYKPQRFKLALPWNRSFEIGIY